MRNNIDIKDFEEKAKEIRRNIVEMVHSAKSAPSRVTAPLRVGPERSLSTLH